MDKLFNALNNQTEMFKFEICVQNRTCLYSELQRLRERVHE